MSMDKNMGFDNISAFPVIRQVQKRSGELVPYDLRKIANAVSKAMHVAEEGDEQDAWFVARSVQSAFQRAATLVSSNVGGGERDLPIPTVEALQDAVERELMLHGFTKTAKHYILYRNNRTKLREETHKVPVAVRNLVALSKTYFRNPLSEFVYYRTYSRWLEHEERRETWIETVDRYMSFMRETLGSGSNGNGNGNGNDNGNDITYADIRMAILSMEVMPSMRLMWAAGDAARATNVAAFNCSYIAPRRLVDFAEILYLLACGTGVGFSVENQSVQHLPIVEPQHDEEPGPESESVRVWVVKDSKEGWADALLEGMTTWYRGEDLRFDLTQLRPEGARLRTMGGRSSGPKPLADLLNFVRGVILKKQGRRLTSLDVHDIVCKIGESIVAGGVRRSALISLSDLDDVAMRSAKEGHFFIANAQRQLANNSAVYVDNYRPSDKVFLREWLALAESGTGERGIFNRGGLRAQVPRRRWAKWKEMGLVASGGQLLAQVGTNPCGEISLLSRQFCNLTEVVCRPDDTYDTLRRKVRIATVLGTYQSMLTNYPYLSPEWQENSEKERLLGVSLTGLWDCEAARDATNLGALKEVAVNTNAAYAEKWGIPPSTAVTCIKPSGTVSLLVDASPGMHPRFSQWYVRRIRIARTDPLLHMLKECGVPALPEVGYSHDDAPTYVLEFPVESAGIGPFSKDLSAIEQLEFWKTVKTCYTEHNPSTTISVKDDEWIQVQAWVSENWEIVGGLSFLPRDDHVYTLAPYEAIDEARYLELLKRFEKVDYSRIMIHEKEDSTSGAKEFACVSGVCEL